MIRLQDLTLQAYKTLKASGMLYEFYPEATGNPNDDLQAYTVAYHYNELTGDRKYFYDIQDEEAEYDF